MFDLPSIFDALGEHAILISYAVAVARNIECRHGIEETGGKPSQAAISQCGIRFYFAHCIEIDFQLLQRFPELRIEAQVLHAVHQRAAYQEFQRKIIDALDIIVVITAHGFHPAVYQAIAHHVGRGEKPVAIGRGSRIFADGIDQAVGKRVFDRVRIETDLFVLKNGFLQGMGHGLSNLLAIIRKHIPLVFLIYLVGKMARPDQA